MPRITRITPAIRKNTVDASIKTPMYESIMPNTKNTRDMPSVKITPIHNPWSEYFFNFFSESFCKEPTYEIIAIKSASEQGVTEVKIPKRKIPTKVISSSCKFVSGSFHVPSAIALTSCARDSAV